MTPRIKSSFTPRFFYGWVMLPACFLIVMVASGTRMAFGVFITPLADAMGWSHSALSFSYALSSIVSGAGVLVVGSLLHTHSVRRLLLTFALLMLPLSSAAAEDPPPSAEPGRGVTVSVMVVKRMAPRRTGTCSRLNRRLSRA